MVNVNALDASSLLNSLTDEDYRSALSYLRFLFEKSERRKISAKNEAAMSRIQSLIGTDRGWASEKDMLKDMAEFRRGRSH